MSVPLPGDYPTVLHLLNDFSGCNFWRAVQPAEDLRLRGYPVYWGWARDNAHAEFISQARIVVMPRLYWLPRDVGKGIRWRDLLHASGTAIVADWDDDLFTVDHLGRVLALNPTADIIDAERDRQARLHALRMVDGITTTTEPLAEAIRSYTDKPVHVVPNLLPRQWFLDVLHAGVRHTQPLTIGWTGGERPDRDFYEMAKAWCIIAERHPEVSFYVQGWVPDVLRPLLAANRLTLQPHLPLEVYAAGYVNIDIGCLPLADTVFNRAKSPIKAFEFAAAGIPVVASPIIYSEVIREGVDGLLAVETGEWLSGLERLIADAEMRRVLAERMWRKVESRYTLDVGWETRLAAWQAIRNSVDFGPWAPTVPLERSGAPA